MSPKMQTAGICVVLALLGFVQGAASQDWKIPQSIEVFTRGDIPVRGMEAVRQRLQSKSVSIVFYDLDAPRAIERQLSEGLPEEGSISAKLQQQIKKQVQRKIEAIGAGKLQEILYQHYQGTFTTMRYQLDRYPAIVFDGKGVVYGVTDVMQAWEQYHQWQP